MICRKATVALPDANFLSSWCQSPSPRAQNRGFCAFLALGTPVFGRSEHKNGFCVSEWAIFPWFLPLPSTKSGFLCAFGCLGHGLQIVRSSILPQILCCPGKRKIADSLVVTISDSLRGVTRNRTGDTRIFSPLLYQLSYDTIAFGIAKIDIFFIIPTICENIFYCCIFTELFLILFEGERVWCQAIFL